MKNSIVLLLIALIVSSFLSAQIKIGDNPQNIDPSSVLELESTDKVLVVTRVTTTQMNAIVPMQGALAYNTDLQSVHYYDGTQWVSIGAGAGGPFTTDPIENAVSTVVITPLNGGSNFEVAPNSIRTEQIVDGGINGVDLQNGSITGDKLTNSSVIKEKISENAVGPHAIQRDSLPLSYFLNDVPFLTAGDINIVSNDPGNILEARADGVFYNDTDGSGGTDDQNLTLTENVIGIEDGNTIDLTPILGSGGGSTTINSTPTVTVAGTGTTADPYLLTSSGGADGSETIIDATNSTIGVTGSGTTANPYILTSNAADVSFTPAGNTLSTNVQNAIEEIQTDLDGLSAGGEANTTSNQGSGGVGLTLTKNVFDLPFKSINAADTGILSVTDDTANNEIDIDIVPATPLTPAKDQMLITNSTNNLVEWAPLSIPTGTSGSIFFSDGSGGLAENNANLFWDTSFGTGGALGIGTNNPQGKLHVAGEIRSEGYNSTFGTEGSPAYSFIASGSDDSNTGMYRIAADELGFSVGGNLALTVDEPSTGVTKVVIKESLEVGASVTMAVLTTSGATTLDDTHYTIILGGNHNITLPLASSVTGRVYIIKNVTVNTPTISSYIDSIGTATTTIGPGVIQLQSDGTNWQQIN
ncbi:hypothetical protein MNBD_BACTEROID03-1215 [hydrothermal vent metagenome]|uniref:Uncharacterized protein n=1 Tax=hydrothermal vent metagenome TaxID=652676 RepID=A0A3B0TG10_9ZZZZ